MTYHLGVDLGTTYTAAAIGRDGRVEAATSGTRSVSVPSVVCLADEVGQNLTTATLSCSLASGG